jgi:hypothetical protein
VYVLVFSVLVFQSMALAGVYSDCALVNDIPQKLHGFLGELALFGFKEQGFFHHDLKVLIGDLIVQLLVIGGGNDKVVHVPMNILRVFLL